SRVQGDKAASHVHCAAKVGNAAARSSGCRITADRAVGDVHCAATAAGEVFDYDAARAGAGITADRAVDDVEVSRAAGYMRAIADAAAAATVAIDGSHADRG